MPVDKIRAQILYVLEHFPIVSPSMLQVGIGNHIKPADWKPVLGDLVREGVVQQENCEAPTPAGRYWLVTKISKVTTEAA